MNRLLQTAVMIAGLGFCIVLPACSTVSASRAERREMIDEAQTRLAEMKQRSPQLIPVLNDAGGYAIFPNVGKGGFVIGGAFGRGALYDRNGQLLGYAKVTQASVGGVVGGRVSSLLLIFQSEAALQRFTAGGDLTFGAEATAIAIETGTSATPQYSNGVAVYILPRGGLMADASLSGQQFAFEKRTDVDETTARVDDDGALDD